MKLNHAVLIVVATAAVLLAGCQRQGVEFIDAWIPLAPPNVKVLAGYLVIRNNTDEALVLRNAASGQFEKIEFHETKHVNEVARMVHIPEVTVPANGEKVFAPGGYHLMLIEPRESLREDETVKIELSFSDQRTVEVEFTVRRNLFKL